MIPDDRDNIWRNTMEPSHDSGYGKFSMFFLAMFPLKALFGNNRE